MITLSEEYFLDADIKVLKCEMPKSLKLGPDQKPRTTSTQVVINKKDKDPLDADTWYTSIAVRPCILQRNKSGAKQLT